MAKTSLLNELFLPSVIKITASVFRALPFEMVLVFSRIIGFAGYYLMPKKRRVVYGNLKTVFSSSKSPAEIRGIGRRVFTNFAQSFAELLCLPKIKRIGFEHFVTLQGRENIEQALSQHKGVIFLAVHAGSWELASMVGSLCGHPYNVVANAQSKAPKLDELLNEYRSIAGAKVIEPGAATRDILRALNNNEIVSLVVDQGGKEGIPVKFLGKTASMSTGALRIGLKYGTPVCPVWISRNARGHHDLKVFPPLDLAGVPENDQGLAEAARRACRHFEGLIHAYPDEYMWFYKVFKYSNDSWILALDDGKTGHLRQTQAAVQILSEALAAKGKNVQAQTATVVFKNEFMSRLFCLYAFLSQIFGFLLFEDALAWFLTEASYQSVSRYKPDFIISAGNVGGCMNFFLSSCCKAKSICLLKPGMIFRRYFDLVILPRHDRPIVALNARLVLIKAALNLITPEYLKKQTEQLLNRYSHLKGNVRTKIGVLIGGNTKGVTFKEGQARLLVRQLKDAAAHFNADILLTTSRRTPASVDALIGRELKPFDRCALCIIANENNIPEAVGGILGLSDLLVVSGESISMVSEAVCSGRRTIVFPPEGVFGRSKYDRFVLGLNEEGVLLASGIKDIAAAINDMMRSKITLKPLDDRRIVRHAIEGII